MLSENLDLFNSIHHHWFSVYPKRGGGASALSCRCLSLRIEQWHFLDECIHRPAGCFHGGIADWEGYLGCAGDVHTRDAQGGHFSTAQ